MILALLAAAVTTTAPPAAASALGTDICLAMIPPKLAANLKSAHPDFDLPSVSDVPVERMMANAASGAWPCPFVTIGDFDGDGGLDRALVLKHKTDLAVRLVAARNDGGQWHIDLQKDWPLAVATVAVEPLDAGLYEQTRGGKDAAKQIDNLKSIQSDHPGFSAGAIDKAKQAFFYVGEEWQTIVLSD